MGPRDPAIISDAISRFLQVAQEREYAEKISSFEETIKSHQADNARLQDHHNQEISSLKANVKSLQASTKKSEVDRANLQDHHSQEISSLQTIVKSLRGSTKNAEAGIAKLQDHHNREDNTLSGVLKSLEGFVEQEADNNQLRDEIAELRAQLGHTGDISAGGGGMRRVLY
jgi:chromosome segregation ATPase